jgi:hypothetical protein
VWLITVQILWRKRGASMAGVVFVFVREDASEAEALAEAFDAAGFSITGKSLGDEALAVVIWSRKALRSRAFKDAAERALCSGRAVIASLTTPPPRESVFDAPVIDLSAWDGEDDAALDPLFEAADEIARPAPSNVIVLPARPVYEDAEFVELAPQITSCESERIRRMRRSWEAPIPTHMLRPVREAPQEKLGAPSPRRDFRRLRVKEGHPRVHAVLAFAVIALLGGGVIAMNAANAPSSAPRAAVAKTQIVDAGAVSFTSASADAAGLDDVAPLEATPLFEPAPQVGRRGLEPPSARRIRRASHAQRYPPGDDRAAYEPPRVLPEDVSAELRRLEALDSRRG